MRLIYTYQEYLDAPDKLIFIRDAIREYQFSSEYLDAVEGEDYFRGKNRAVLRRRSKIQSLGETSVTLDLNKTKIPTNFFKRFVIQQAGTLLNYGLQLKDVALKPKLGVGFDTTLSITGEKSLIHGVSYLFWDYDHYVNFTALECFILADERTQEPKVGIRFWSNNGKDKPTFVELYEIDGVTELVINGNGNNIEITAEKRAYRYVIRPATNTIENTGNYNGFPIIPLYANEYHTSELSLNIKSKIDLYDLIFSDFGDVMERIKGVVWVLNNFSGTGNDAAKIIEEIEKLGILAVDDERVSADMKTFDIPHSAVTMALDLLEKALYKDFMAMNMDEITGGSLTNVAIDTARDNLMKKVGRWERQQVLETCRKALSLIGIETENMLFRYDTIENEHEKTQMVMLAADFLDYETLLKKLPFIDNDEIEDIMARKAIEDLQQADLTYPIEEEIKKESFE